MQRRLWQSQGAGVHETARLRQLFSSLSGSCVASEVWHFIGQVRALIAFCLWSISSTSSKSDCRTPKQLFYFIKQPASESNQAYRAISTGQLNALLRLHLRPIDVVVFHDSQGDLVLWGASRLDAFSGYPVRS